MLFCMARHRRSLTLGILLWLAAAPTSLALRAQDSPGTKAPTPDAFRFDWPVPGSVRVEKVGVKRGNQATLRYRLELQPAAESTIRVRQRDFEFVTVNGQDATTPAMKQKLASAMAMTQAVPDLVVDPAGEYLRIDGLDAMMESFSRFQRDQKGQSEAETQRILKAMRTPEVTAALQQACSKDWSAWVGAWVGFDVPPGEQAEEVGEVPVFGATLPAKVTRRHHGAAAGHPGYVRLSITSLVEGAEAAKALAVATDALVRKAGSSPIPVGALESIRVETSLEVITEPKTLRPLRATWAKDMRLVTKDEGTHSDVESAEFRFTFEPPPAAK
jgi:hypothetical protein